MGDNFEFDDDDDVLLRAICTQSEKTTPIKRLIQTNNESDLVKRRRTNDCNDSLSPVFKESPNNCGDSKKIHSSNISPTNAVRRIFPGPAGILSDDNITMSQIEVCSQSTSSVFEDSLWEEMSKDFRISSSLHLLDKFNIAWIKKEAAANQFTIRKAPFLAGKLISLEVSEGQTQKSVNITLKDRTGTIQGNILYSLYKEHASSFTLDSILILVQFGVLSCTCDKCDNHHLTITPKNLCAIYNGKEKVVIKKVVPDEILADFFQQKKELAQHIRSQSLMKRTSTGSSPIVSNNRPNQTMTSIIPPYHPIQKSSGESFLVPKFKTVSENNVQNSTASAPSSSSKCQNEPKKLFTFKKVPLAGEASTSCHSSKFETNFSNFENKIRGTDREFHSSCGSKNIGLNSVNEPVNYSPKTICKRTSPPPKNKSIFEDYRQDRLEDPVVNLNNTNSEPTKSFTSRKVPLSDSAHQSHGRNSIQTVESTIQSFTKTPGKQIAVKVDQAEHEKLWKDALADMDINTLFDDDY